MQAVEFALVSAILLVCSAACCDAAGQPFDYANQTAWTNLPGSVCGSNSRQSPIDILASQTIVGANLRRLQLVGWNMPVDGTLQNTGATLKFTPTSSSSQNTVTTNHIGDYTLAQFHLHWGNSTGEGSEHLLNGRRYEAEIHFVHARTQPPSNGTEGDAFAVVGVFLQISQTATINGTVWEKFRSKPAAGQSMDITGVTYNDFLPAGNHSYYYYEGSLTTPPCSEVVQWFVLQNPIPIPAEILQWLRTTPANVNQTSAVQAMNYRDTQPLNGRQVYRYNSASTFTPILGFTLMSMLAVVMSLIMF